MSRTDPQFNLRIPETLRDKVVAAAKENGRSSTAEILARLELSFLGDAPSDDLIPANKARQMSQIARQSIPSTVKKRISQSISEAISLGHDSLGVKFEDLGLESMPEQDINDLIEAFSEMLEDAGYTFEWDGVEQLWIHFSPFPGLPDLN
jgi:hypothetical protein